MRMLINVFFLLGSLTMNLPINLLIRVNALNEKEELRKSVPIKCISHEFIDVYLFSSFSYDSSKKHAFRTKAILLALVSDFYLYRKCTFKSFFYIFTACKTFIRVIELDIIPIQNFLL